VRDDQLYEELLRLSLDGVTAALAVLVERRGSAPQHPGAKMVVRADRTISGTVGGGQLEAEVIDMAIDVLREGKPRTEVIALTPERGYLCGGVVRVYIEPVYSPPRLVILGAGHVGKAVAELAHFLGFRVVVADDRRNYAAAEKIPHAECVILADFATPFVTIPVDPKTYLLVATRGHAHDFEAVRAALLTPAHYIGLLGSRKKQAAFRIELLACGFDDQALGRVRMPVGLAIGSVSPQEIAVSIMAEIIQHRRQNGGVGIGEQSAVGCGQLAPHGAAQAAAAGAG